MSTEMVQRAVGRQEVGVPYRTRDLNLPPYSYAAEISKNMKCVSITSVEGRQKEFVRTFDLRAELITAQDEIRQGRFSHWSPFKCYGCHYNQSNTVGCKIKENEFYRPTRRLEKQLRENNT